MHTAIAPSLPCAGQLTICFLNANNVDAMQSLQAEVYQNLPPDCKSFIVPKTMEDFNQHLKRPGSLAIGVFHGTELIAQCLIVNPSDEHPETGMVDMRPPNCVPQEISVIQGLLVSPRHRGLRIGARLIAEWQKVCAQGNKTRLLVETAVANRYSWSLFLDAGIPIVSHGIDPTDDTHVFNHLKICN